MTRIACIGECMIELSRIDLEAGQARVGFAGDTFNTAVYLSRLRPAQATVSYVTVLGEDAFSARILALLAQERVATDLIGRHPSRLPGLYSIETDAAGERSFRYWREASAARTLFAGTGAGLDDLGRFDMIYLSGITLAILPDGVRGALIDRLGALKAAGRRIVFDTNYRPRLWPDAATAGRAFEAMWRATSLGLPSFDDEAALSPGASPLDVAERIAALGVGEIVLKNGAAGPLICAGGAVAQTAFAPARRVVDTTGAGDSFNAGYLAARLRGATPMEAALAGHDLATAVIGQPGAIIGQDAMPGR